MVVSFIKKQLLKKGLTINWLAKKINLKLEILNNFLEKDSNLPTSILLKICEVLNIDLNFLFEVNL